MSSAPSWELSKENVAPLARGRDKSSLNLALHASAAARFGEGLSQPRANDAATSVETVASMHAAHEAALDAAMSGDGPHASDPLAPASAFVKWAADAYQPKATPLLRALERSCRAFVGDARYTNDPRFVRLWVRYADVRNDPLDCFSYMRAHGIGETSSLFYEAWATTLEYKKDFQMADTTYKLGLDRDAQPRARLEQRQREFLSRMVARDQRATRRDRNSKKSQERATKGAVPFVALSCDFLESLDSVATRTASGGENVRPALGGLSSRQAKSGQRPLATSSTAAPGRPLASANSGAGRTALSEVSAPFPAGMGQTLRSKPCVNADTSFKIFADPRVSSAELQNNSGVQDVGRSLPTLAKLDEVRKENEGELPSQWAGSVLPQSSPLARARERTRQRHGGAAPFDFYTDSHEEDPGLDPLHGNPCKSQAVLEQSTSLASATAGPPSPTINTKLANKLVEDMFNTTLPCERDITESSVEPSVVARSHGKMALSDMEVDYEPLERVEPGQSAVEPGISANGPAKSKEDWYAETCIDICPDFPCYRMMVNNCNELASGSVVQLQGEGEAGRSFFVESKLGEGAEGNSSVFSASALDSHTFGDGHDEDEDEMNVAIKVSEGVKLLWEFYIYNVLVERVQDTRSLLSFPRALFFYHGEPQAYLITDRVSVASLAQMVELRSLDGGISDSAAVFFFVEILRALEIVHSTGIIHADLSLENIVIRKDGSERWSGPYDPSGRNGWGGKGVSLIDFNNAVDTRHEVVGARTGPEIVAHTSFIGDAHMKSDYLAGERGSPWGFNADCFSTSVCARKLRGDTKGKTLDVWDAALESLESVSPEALGAESSRTIQECRHKLEDLLIAQSRGDEGAQLRAELKSIFVAAAEARQANDVTRG